MKMSYDAYLVNFTISELWIKSIINTFKFLRDSD